MLNDHIYPSLGKLVSKSGNGTSIGKTQRISWVDRYNFIQTAVISIERSWEVFIPIDYYSLQAFSHTNDISVIG